MLHLPVLVFYFPLTPSQLSPSLAKWPLAFAALCLWTYCVIVSITKAFRGPKELLTYTTLHPLSGITNLVFIHQARKGFRSKAIFEALKKWPVARIDRQLS